MNKVELVKAVATKTGFTQKDIKAVMDAMQDVVHATMKTEEVKIMDGITLEAVYKEAHEGRNPKTGETVKVPGKYAPRAKFGRAVREALNA